MTMSNKEKVIRDLYNALEKLKYPEVAQINYEEFEATILTGNRRVALLHWLLQENQNFNCTLLNKLKEVTLEGKLLKCYDQMGFCSSEDVLLGKCKIEDQLHFLSLLTLFIKRTYSVESPKSDKENTNILLKADTENITPKKDCRDKQQSNSKNETTLHEVTTSELFSSTVDKQKTELDNLCCSIKLILQEPNKHQNDNYEPKLQKFYTSFKNVTNLPLGNCLSNKSSDDPSNISSNIEQIHTAFSTINKALNNEVEFSNQLVPENTDKIAKPLSAIISNNVVLIEQACNMLKDNQVLN